MGRTSTARERLVDAAGELIHHRGYNSLGVAEVCARADVRKGSFYHFFESKQALTVQVLQRYWQTRREEWTTILGSEPPALERLEALFRAQAEAQTLAQRAAGTVNGCLLANLALELSTQDDVVRAHLDEIFAEQAALIQDTLDQAAREGTITADRATPRTARSLLAHLEGMVLFAKVANDPAILDDLWPQSALLLGPLKD
ncbi:TetR/AcrR family transcriptional regulator [Actinoplanes sp. NPDC051346]|uniref:TetR/AcrR family transcriptional regulator n=1 Tax=Actinoplanes sp. NPDC051346 TaxID=3155048 RepID=UPI003412A498